MKTSPQPYDPVADEQAALWAARLDGDTLTSEQRAELDAWLAGHPAHRALLSQYCQFSADLEEQVPALVAAGAVTMPETRNDAVRRPPRRLWPRFTAVALAAAAAIAVTFIVLKPDSPNETVAMAPGQRGSHTLADGTRIELNANTSLRFTHSATERRVQLGGGEALFMVAKDPSRPFFVETPAGSVRVTGTTFNVRTEAAATAFEVTVIEGSVQVRSGVAGAGQSTEPVSLRAGDQFIARPEGQTKNTLSPADLEDALAWRQGQIVFKGSSLREAAARYAQYHGRTIQVDPAVATQGVGGQFSIDDLPFFLTSIERAMPVSVHKDLNGTVITLSPRRTP